MVMFNVLLLSSLQSFRYLLKKGMTVFFIVFFLLLATVQVIILARYNLIGLGL
jgi:hypothetical protein